MGYTEVLNDLESKDDRSAKHRVPFKPRGKALSSMQAAADWRDLKEFAGINLDKSFVLSWHAESEQFCIDVDLQIAETHPKYEKPRPKEKVCIRPAIIEFPYCDEVSVDGRPAASLQAATEHLRHGLIHGLRRLPDDRYEIKGEFGTVSITAERPLIRIKGR